MNPVTLEALFAAKEAVATAKQKLAESEKHAAGYARQVEKRRPLVATAEAELARLTAEFSKGQPQQLAKKSA